MYQVADRYKIVILLLFLSFAAKAQRIDPVTQIQFCVDDQGNRLDSCLLITDATGQYRHTNFDTLVSWISAALNVVASGDSLTTSSDSICTSLSCVALADLGISTYRDTLIQDSILVYQTDGIEVGRDTISRGDAADGYIGDVQTHTAGGDLDMNGNDIDNLANINVNGGFGVTGASFGPILTLDGASATIESPSIFWQNSEPDGDWRITINSGDNDFQIKNQFTNWMEFRFDEDDIVATKDLNLDGALLDNADAATQSGYIPMGTGAGTFEWTDTTGLFAGADGYIGDIQTHVAGGDLNMSFNNIDSIADMFVHGTATIDTAFVNRLELAGGGYVQNTGTRVELDASTLGTYRFNDGLLGTSLQLEQTGFDFSQIVFGVDVNTDWHLEKTFAGDDFQVNYGGSTFLTFDAGTDDIRFGKDVGMNTFDLTNAGVVAASVLDGGSLTSGPADVGDLNIQNLPVDDSDSVLVANGSGDIGIKILSGGGAADSLEIRNDSLGIIGSNAISLSDLVSGGGAGASTDFEQIFTTPNIIMDVTADSTIGVPGDNTGNQENNVPELFGVDLPFTGSFDLDERSAVYTYRPKTTYDSIHVAGYITLNDSNTDTVRVMLMGSDESLQDQGQTGADNVTFTRLAEQFFTGETSDQIKLIDFTYAQAVDDTTALFIAVLNQANDGQDIRMRASAYGYREKSGGGSGNYDPGAVLFAGDDGSIGEDTSKIYFDSTSTALLIGGTKSYTPFNRFQVFNEGNTLVEFGSTGSGATQFRMNTDDGSNRRFLALSSTAPEAQINFGDDGKFDFYQETTGLDAATLDLNVGFSMDIYDNTRDDGQAESIAGFDASGNLMRYTSIDSVIYGSDSLASSASITYDYRDGRNAEIVLEENATLTFTNIPDGAEGHVSVTQDATGSRTLGFAGSGDYTTLRWRGGDSTISTAAGITDVIGCMRIKDILYLTLGLDFQ